MSENKPKGDILALLHGAGEAEEGSNLVIRRTPLLITALLLTSCQGKEVLTIDDYWSAREDCLIERDEFIPIPSGRVEAYKHIQEGCVERIAVDVGYLWETFDDSPHRIEMPTTDGEIALSGLFTVLASDMGELGALRESDLPEPLAAEVELVAAEAGIEDHDPAGAFWWLYYRRWVETVYRDSLDSACVELNARMFYDNVYDKAVGICGLEGESNVEAVSVASDMIHEASHGLQPQHDSGFNDLSSEGVWGIHARWLADWIIYNRGNVSSADCADAQSHLDWLCYYIEDPGDYGPCVESPNCTVP